LPRPMTVTEVLFSVLMRTTLAARGGAGQWQG
jgi:hypothetical protein